MPEKLCVLLIWHHLGFGGTSENSSTKDTVIIQNTFGMPLVYKCVTKSDSQCEWLHFSLCQGDHDIGITAEWLQLK